MAWQLLKVQHHAVMVINDASSCEDVNEVRDDESGYCKSHLARLWSAGLLSPSCRCDSRLNFACRLRHDVSQRRTRQSGRRHQRHCCSAGKNPTGTQQLRSLTCTTVGRRKRRRLSLGQGENLSQHTRLLALQRRIGRGESYHLLVIVSPSPGITQLTVCNLRRFNRTRIPPAATIQSASLAWRARRAVGRTLALGTTHSSWTSPSATLRARSHGTRRGGHVPRNPGEDGDRERLYQLRRGREVAAVYSLSFAFTSLSFCLNVLRITKWNFSTHFKARS